MADEDNAPDTKAAPLNEEERVIMLAGIFVAGFWLISLITILIFGNVSKTGAFGDSFGPVTALFSGLAFAGIVITLYLQRGDLRLQRKMLEAQHNELRATNEQLSGQKEQMRVQNKFIEKQNFEATFFRMLQNFYSLIDGIDHDIVTRRRKGSELEKSINTLTGRDALKHFSERLYYAVITPEEEQPNNKNKEMTDLYTWENRYYELYNFLDSDISVYFRNLYNLILYVHSDETISQGEKYRYIKLIRATLSPYECLLIFLNGQTKYARENMLPLIHTYSLLKHLPQRYRDEAYFIANEYSPSAFSRQNNN